MATAPKPASSRNALSGYDWPAIIKDLIGTAVITFLILTPIVSFRTILDQGDTQPDHAVAAGPWPYVAGCRRPTAAASLPVEPGGRAQHAKHIAGFRCPDFSSIGKYVGPALLVIAILLPYCFRR